MRTQKLKIAGNSGNYCQCQVPRKTEKGGPRQKSPVRRLPIPPRPEAGARSAAQSHRQLAIRHAPTPRRAASAAPPCRCLSLQQRYKKRQEPRAAAAASPHVFVLSLDKYSPRPASQLPSHITSCSPRPHALRPLVLTPSSSHHLVLSSHPALSRREAAPVS